MIYTPDPWHHPSCVLEDGLHMCTGWTVSPGSYSHGISLNHERERQIFTDFAGGEWFNLCKLMLVNFCHLPIYKAT